MQTGHHYGNVAAGALVRARGWQAEMLRLLTLGQDRMHMRARGLGLPALPSIVRACLTQEEEEALVAELELAVQKMFAIMAIALRDSTDGVHSLRDMAGIVGAMDEAFFLFCAADLSAGGLPLRRKRPI